MRRAGEHSLLFEARTLTSLANRTGQTNSPSIAVNASADGILRRIREAFRQDADRTPAITLRGGNAIDDRRSSDSRPKREPSKDEVFCP
jgi:hypothetical protein